MHIHFNDSDEEGERQQAHGHASTSGASLGAQGSGLHLAGTVRTDFDRGDQCYVLALAAAPNQPLVAVALSNKRTKLFSVGPTGLQYTGELSGHGGAITDAAFPLPAEPHLLYTSSRDGTVRGWDVRSGQQAEGYSAGSKEVQCFSANGALVAAGAADNILFWDRRTHKAAAVFGDTHAQDVTALCFAPDGAALLSGSEDGLVAVFDTRPALDEDDGFKAALNIETSVARFGLWGAGGSRLWVCSGTETLHLWDWAAACDEDVEGGAGAAAALDARERLTEAAAASPAGRDLATAGVDYLVGCHYSPAADRLWALAGSSGGALGLFPVAPPCRVGPPGAVLAGGHDDVVRALVWPDPSGSVCVTGGEDSRLCLWAADAVASAAAAQRPSGSATSSDGAVRKHAQQHARRAAPY